VKSERPHLDSIEPSSRSSYQPPRQEQKTLVNEAFSLRPPNLRKRAVLVRMDSVHAGQVTSLDGPEARIGRHPDNTIVVDDDGLSRVHARVYYYEGVYVVEDLGSSNGSYVNGQRVDARTLFEGAVLQFGPSVCFRFSITDENQEKILRQLYETSVRDGLTGAYNRHFFVERLSGEVSYASRHAAQASIVMYDVDQFKKINDTYGHQAGDDVLRNLAATTRKHLRVEDVFARYGGEEFIVLLRGVSLRGAERAAERLRQYIVEAPTESGGEVIEATVSMGCASVDCIEQRDAETLIAVADRRLYIAKGAGRNRVVADG